MRFGINMFGVAQQFRENPDKFLADAHAMGYRYIEPCIALSEVPGFEQYFWSVAEFESFYEKITFYKMELVSCHIFARDLLGEIPTLKELVRKYGIKQFVCGCPREIDLDIYREFAKKMVMVSEQLSDFGAELLLHNNYQEVEEKLEDICAYEWLLKACDGKVKAQVDVGWLLYGGQDPNHFLWKNERYIKSLHYKDIQGISGEISAQNSNICLGMGKLDVFSAFQFARAKGIPQIIDQDTSEGSIIEDLEESKKLLDSFLHRRDNTRSILNILDTKTGEVKRLESWDKVIEAPNWLKDEDTLLFNSEGLIYSYRISTGKVERIDTGLCDNCNNDHVLSPGHKELAISHSPKGGWMSQIYVLPIEGGEPRLVTKEAPSFLHGWSFDGNTLSYTAFRGTAEMGSQADIYSISTQGGEEKRLTFGEGLNDGPEYAPNNEHIWFNSTRSGLMQIWRMDLDGSNTVQMTFEENNNWFPHISPDCSKVVNLSYKKEHLEPHEHLPNMQAEIWLMNYDGSGRKMIHSFFGGQGSINVNSWSFDNQHVAFVSYELI